MVLAPFLNLLSAPWFRLPASDAGDVSVDGEDEAEGCWNRCLAPGSSCLGRCAPHFRTPRSRSPPRVPYTGSDDRSKVLKIVFPGTAGHVAENIFHHHHCTRSSRKVDHRTQPPGFCLLITGERCARRGDNRSGYDAVYVRMLLMSGQSLEMVARTAYLKHA